MKLQMKNPLACWLFVGALVVLAMTAGAEMELGEGIRPVDAIESLQEFKAIRTQAEQGDAVAQESLGWAYADGRVVPRDYPEAVRWFRSAVEAGKPNGFFWAFRGAVEENDAEAQYTLGLLYAGPGVYARGVSILHWDMAHGLHWFTEAASQGHDGAKKQILVNLDEYEKEAEKGSPEFQSMLGLALGYVPGVLDDEDANKFIAEMGLHWLTRAAKQGHAESQHNLGAINFNVWREVVSIDGQKTLRLLHHAREAYVWFYVAKTNGYPATLGVWERVMDTLSLTFSPDELHSFHKDAARLRMEIDLGKWQEGKQ